MNWKKAKPRLLLALAGVGLVAFVGLILVVWTMFPHATHSLRQYETLRAQWDPKLVAHFPDSIPDSANLKRFSHHPGFLQGGAHIQLRLALPSGQIRDLHAHFMLKRTRSFFGGDTNDHMNVKDGMPTTFFMTGDGEQNSFPEDYEIMIFDRLLPESERPEGHYWNHGQSHGVAISKERSEIVYWAKVW